MNLEAHLSEQPSPEAAAFRAVIASNAPLTSLRSSPRPTAGPVGALARRPGLVVLEPARGGMGGSVAPLAVGATRGCVGVRLSGGGGSGGTESPGRPRPWP